ncbi:hypothetical protein D3C86_1943990 [compost metagenome]
MIRTVAKVEGKVRLNPGVGKVFFKADFKAVVCYFTVSCFVVVVKFDVIPKIISINPVTDLVIVKFYE